MLVRAHVHAHASFTILLLAVFITITLLSVSNYTKFGSKVRAFSGQRQGRVLSAGNKEPTVSTRPSGTALATL